MAETCRRQHNKVGHKKVVFWPTPPPPPITYNTTGMMLLKTKLLLSTCS